MYKGAVFLDYDGTLIDESEQIYSPPKDCISALEKLKRNGYFTAICSGRAICHIPKNLNFEFDGYVNSNGSSVTINKKLIFNDCFDEKDLKAIIKYFEDRKIDYSLEVYDRCYVNNMKNPRFLESVKKFELPEETYIPFTGQKIFDKVNKIVNFYENYSQMSDFNEYFGNKFIVFPQLFDYSVDIAKRGLSKAIGIKEAIKYLNIDIKDTYAFGDGGNDIEMLSEIGNPIIMGKHHPSLDNIKNGYITETVSNGGIEKGLIHFKLI